MLERNQELYRAAMKGNWEAAEEIFWENPDAILASLSSQGMTALHVAASCGQSEFVEKLVKILPPSVLEKTDQIGRTALHHVALASSVSAAAAMVDKNPNLPQIGDMNSFTPLYYAAAWRHPLKSKEMVKYLRQVTKDEPPCQPFTGPSATNLIVYITLSRLYDTALDLVENYPKLALNKNDEGLNILHALAIRPASFRQPEPSLSEFSFGQWMRTKTEQRHSIAVVLAETVCRVLRKQFSAQDIMNYFLPKDQYGVLQLAIMNGDLELVKVCLHYFPEMIWYTSPRNNRLPLHDAIECRQVEIFNYLIHLIGENTKAYADIQLEDQNNILHLAAKSASSGLLLSVPDPAFEMAQELRWYKAVEVLVYEKLRVMKNKDGHTPAELFSEEHKELLGNAKEWMKNTSNSCMVVAALVATVAFAAMITVPGGNDSGTGVPILAKEKLFIAFSISNAASMISSAVSLLLFLSVQTSRDREEDFLESLPNILLKGLSFLFIAVATMMIAFGTAIGLSLEKRVNWAYIPITVVACCPAAIFTRLQLPLLFRTIEFTSGPGIFQTKAHIKLRNLIKIACCLRSNGHVSKHL